MEALLEWGWFFAVVVLAIVFYRFCGLSVGWVNNLKIGKGIVHILFSIYFFCFSAWAGYFADALRVSHESLPYLSPPLWLIVLSSALLLGTSFFIAKGLLFGCALLAFGAIANISVVLLNDGQMPVKVYGFESIVIEDDVTGEFIGEFVGGGKELSEAVKSIKTIKPDIRVRFGKSAIHTVMMPEHKLKDLADIIFVQFSNVSVVISFGDLLMFLGVFMFLVEVFTKKEEKMELNVGEKIEAIADDEIKDVN